MRLLWPPVTLVWVVWECRYVGCILGVVPLCRAWLGPARARFGPARAWLGPARARLKSVRAWLGPTRAPGPGLGLPGPTRAWPMPARAYPGLPGPNRVRLGSGPQAPAWS